MRRRPLKPWIIGFTILVAIIILGNTTSVLSFLQKPFDVTLKPLFHSAQSIGVWLIHLPDPLKNANSLAKKIEELEKENTRLQAENAKIQSTLNSLTIQEQMSSFLQQRNYQGIAAHVIGKDITNEHTLLIDKGSDDAILEQYPVITSEGVLVGRISKVTPKTAFITLITDPSQKIAAKIQNDAQSPGVISGQFGLSLYMELIPQTDILEKGQAVVTSSSDIFTPSDIYIGNLARINRQEGSVFQDAQVVSPLDLQRVTIVSVILPPHVQ